jgi:hypothetical protein
MKDCSPEHLVGRSLLDAEGEPHHGQCDLVPVLQVPQRPGSVLDHDGPLV